MAVTRSVGTRKNEKILWMSTGSRNKNTQSFLRSLTIYKNQLVTTVVKNFGILPVFALSDCCNYFFTCYTPVHCRTGSLENEPTPGGSIGQVHCRTGSLEMSAPEPLADRVVHCRTGSLENQLIFTLDSVCVHCRTGSLEICHQ